MAAATATTNAPTTHGNIRDRRNGSGGGGSGRIGSTRRGSGGGAHWTEEGVVLPAAYAPVAARAVSSRTARTLSHARIESNQVAVHAVAERDANEFPDETGLDFPEPRTSNAEPRTPNAEPVSFRPHPRTG